MMIYKKDKVNNTWENTGIPISSLTIDVSSNEKGDVLKYGHICYNGCEGKVKIISMGNSNFQTECQKCEDKNLFKIRGYNPHDLNEKDCNHPK